MILWICLAGIMLAGCGKKTSDTVQRVTVGVAYYDRNDTFLGELITTFRDKMQEVAGEAFKVSVTVVDAAGSQRTQNDQVIDLINEGCSVLCVNLVDRTYPSEIIDSAREKDIPVIFFNREPVAEDMRQWDKLYYVGADAGESGNLQGEIAAQLIKDNSQVDRNKDGVIQYVMLEGEPGHQDAIIRTENAVKTLQKEGIKIEKLGCGIANWNRSQAENRMQQMIGLYQNRIELVLANNDDMVLGAIDVYKKLNYTDSAKPIFVGIDGTEVGLQAVLDRTLVGTVHNDKEGQAAAMAQLARALITGTGLNEISFTNDKYVYLPYSKITKDNIEQYLN